MFNSDIIISPSILSADFCHLADEIDSITQAGATWAHVDVMDGHFVPNLSIGVPLLASLKSYTDLPLDVHLMISNPRESIDWYLAYTPYMVTVHWEALDPARPNDEARDLVDRIHAAGVRAGISLKPDTPVEVLKDTLHLWDMILVMSVNPGFSGQSFMPDTPEKIRDLVALLNEVDAHPLIQVDGGISPKTAPLVKAAGADVLVAGNAVFKAADRAQVIQELKTH